MVICNGASVRRAAVCSFAIEAGLRGRKFNAQARRHWSWHGRVLCAERGTRTRANSLRLQRLFSHLSLRYSPAEMHTMPAVRFHSAGESTRRYYFTYSASRRHRSGRGNIGHPAMPGEHRPPPEHASRPPPLNAVCIGDCMPKASGGSTCGCWWTGCELGRHDMFV